MSRRRRQAAGRRCAGLALAAALGGLPACNVVSGVGEIEFFTCSIHLDEGDDTALAGGDGGGVFDDVCPEGQVLVGFEGGVFSFGASMAGLVATCGEASLSSEDARKLAVTPGEDLPARGGTADGVRSATCPADQVIVGFEGDTFTDTQSGGTYLSKLAVRCAPLVISGLPETPALARGPITTLESIGYAMDDLGAPFPAIDCPDRQIAWASRGQAASVIDAFGLGCAEPVIRCSPEPRK